MNTTPTAAERQSELSPEEQRAWRRSRRLGWWSLLSAILVLPSCVVWLVREFPSRPKPWYELWHVRDGKRVRLRVTDEVPPIREQAPDDVRYVEPLASRLSRFATHVLNVLQGIAYPLTLELLALLLGLRSRRIAVSACAPIPRAARDGLWICGFNVVVVVAAAPFLLIR